MPESAEISGSTSLPTSLFGIPLSFGNRSYFESWGKNASNDIASADDAQSQVVGGLNEFIGDHENRLLKCLVENRFYSLFESTESGNDCDEDFQPIRSLVPLVLYGETGTGKTALALTLISRFIQQSNDDESVELKPICLSGSEFFRRHLAAIDRQSMTEFRQRILSCSGLVIDNIEQLVNKVSAQRELSFLIDRLIELGKPVVATCKKSPLSPASTSQLIPALLSRLSGGVNFPVYPPGLEARREIIARLADLHRVELTKEAAEWVANRMAVSVPKLNHFFVQLKTELKSRFAAKDRAAAKPSHADNPMTDRAVDMVTLALIFQQDSNANELMAKRIVESVAEDFELTVSQMSSNSRKQTIVMARGVAIWLERTLLGTSYHKIGVRYGNRDHTTILHAFQKFDALLKEKPDSSETNSALCNRIRYLQQRLNETFAGQMTLIQ
jgi:chromosomal replication initiator protein